MRRRDFLKSAGLGAAVGATAVTGLWHFADKAKETPTSELPHGIAVLFDYSVGHAKSIIVSSGDWQIGDPIDLSGVRYTVIEQEHGWHYITEWGQILWFHGLQYEAQRLWLDRPLELACPEGTEAIRPLTNVYVPSSYCAGDKYCNWVVEDRRTGKRLESFESVEPRSLQDVLKRCRNTRNVQIRPVTGEEIAEFKREIQTTLESWQA